MNLQEIMTRRAETVAVIAQKRDEFNAAVRAAEARLSALNDAEKLIGAGLDVDQIEAGKSIVYVSGKVLAPVKGWHGDGSGVRLSILGDAKLDLALGAPRMRAGFLGAKNYEAFGDQRSDHPYGYGPRHGSIVFAIGLTSDARAVYELTPKEIEYGLFYLSSLIKIEAALAEPVLS